MKLPSDLSSYNECASLEWSPERLAEEAKYAEEWLQGLGRAEELVMKRLSGAELTAEEKSHLDMYYPDTK
ncbi:hypothetical protein ACI2KR_06760 [Pseudomonas luteola]